VPPFAPSGREAFSKHEAASRGRRKYPKNERAYQNAA
jgi:hypothetical protein